MMNKLGCTLCILTLSSFSDEIKMLKDEKDRMHIVHPGFFILQLTESAEIIELKYEKTRMHIVNPSFCILQLTQGAEINEQKNDK